MANEPPGTSMDCSTMGWAVTSLGLNGQHSPLGERPEKSVLALLEHLAMLTFLPKEHSGPAGVDATSPDRPKGTAMQLRHNYPRPWPGGLYAPPQALRSGVPGRLRAHAPPPPAGPGTCVRGPLAPHTSRCPGLWKGVSPTTT